SAQAEVVASLTYPYLVGPFRRLESVLDLYDARTRLSLSLLTARLDRLGLLIRGRGNARYRLELRHKPTVTSLVDLFEISLSNPDTMSGFRKDVLERLLAPLTDPVQEAQILEDYTVPQVNTAVRYTLRSAELNPLRRERGYSYEFSAEAGSNLPYLLDRFVYSPGTVEGSLPGIPIFTERGAPSRLIYRQYVRFVADARRYRPISSESVLAVKLIGGFAQPTGRSEIVPFDRRFYSGGASSVRGWGLRELGPGAATFTGLRDSTNLSGDVTNILGGDVKLEAAVELRNILLRSLFAADWVGVLFLDAGNVWFGPRNPGFGEDSPQSSDGRFHADSFFREIGVGSGLGMRTAWEYLILRLDFGFKVYDPTRVGLFPDGLRDVQIHFGIGHTF
ncbi:MAG: BamA/TamA family outer membrane protein, partial [Rhodothermales bacterium]